MSSSGLDLPGASSGPADPAPRGYGYTDRAKRVPPPLAAYRCVVLARKRPCPHIRRISRRGRSISQMKDPPGIGASLPPRPLLGCGAASARPGAARNADSGGAIGSLRCDTCPKGGGQSPISVAPGPEALHRDMQAGQRPWAARGVVAGQEVRARPRRPVPAAPDPPRLKREPRSALPCRFGPFWGGGVDRLALPPKDARPRCFSYH